MWLGLFFPQVVSAINWPKGLIGLLPHDVSMMGVGVMGTLFGTESLRMMLTSAPLSIIAVTL